MLEIFYEIAKRDGKQSIIIYLRSNGILNCFGWRDYDSDPENIFAIKRCIDDFFESTRKHLYIDVDEYVAYRLREDKKFTIKNKTKKNL